jgi:hypothetical protein
MLPNGAIGVWHPLPPLHHKRSATAVAVAGRAVYVVGGMDNQGVLSAVEMANLGVDGKLGYSATSP